jgi:uncharacterized protein YqhQ
MSKSRMPSYGGQALFEGVLMRGSRYLAAAMRAPNGEIVVQTEELSAIYQSRLRKIPFLRGLVILWDALGLGTRWLTISTNLHAEKEEEKIEGKNLTLVVMFSLLISIGLFFLLPAVLGKWIENMLGWSAWGGYAIEGIFRLLILIGYIWGVGRSKEIARFFGYHGAEHKTINAFEANSVLNVKTVSSFSLQHPRCGTAFMLTLVVFSIILFSLLGPLPILWRLVTRILFIPFLASLAYEYLRWTADHLENPLVRLLVIPNLAMQSLTTREPSSEMLEVAIAAFEAMRSKELEGETKNT